MGTIALSDTGERRAGKRVVKRNNPYLDKGTAFSAETYGVFLLARLDGWSWDAQALIDRSLAAVKGASFLLDADPSEIAASCAGFAVAATYGGSCLTAAAKPQMPDQTNTFVGGVGTITGYLNWGSNRPHFWSATYQAIWFAPGAIAATAVSTSGSNTRYAGGCQSQMAQLVRAGVTGAKRYRSEPCVDALANPIFLSYRYASGRMLAEAHCSASAYMGWKDVELGDPLCAPYRWQHSTSERP